MVSVFKFVVLIHAISFATLAKPAPEITTSLQSGITTLDIVSGRENFEFDEYYRIDESKEATQLDLLDLVQVNKKFPKPAEPYDRRHHFGTWINPVSDESCMNVRGLVLARDAISPVTETPNGCAVADGVWYDPYSGQKYESPTEIQIDHFVPLKNAYMTGAHEWSQAKRCLYANFLGNDFHLKAVSGKENMSKGDASPARYLPTNKAYVCEYIKTWLQVKLIWQLRLTPVEVEAVERLALQEKCDKNSFHMNSRELAEQRAYMEANAAFCAHGEPVASPTYLN